MKFHGKISKNCATSVAPYNWPRLRSETRNISRHLTFYWSPTYKNFALIDVLMVIEDPVIYTVLCLMVNPHRASAATLALLLPLEYIYNVTLGNWRGNDSQASPKDQWSLPLPLTPGVFKALVTGSSFYKFEEIDDLLTMWFY